ncbi:MAG: glycosyltransferase family 4 protein [Armatimonadota bacterium]|nr:glycosyltransferase family 4 protein [bacterium]MDW8322250.1 glycosyltransferase family 4 protein [Armatimonadota bacterium]
MRVLHLARPAAGGVLRFLQNVVPRLEQEGVECVIACPASMHSSLSPLRTLRWEVSDRPHPLADLHCALQAKGWQKGYDLFHAHGLRTAGVLALLPPRQWLFSLHNLPPEHLAPPARWLLKRAAHSAGRILAVSQAVRIAWLHHFPQSGEKCEVAPGGVDVDAIRPDMIDRLAARQQWNLPESAPVALCVARLMEDKGVDVLLRALALRPEWFALVVGEGPQRDALVRLASELRLEERVRFTGFLPSLDSVWSACDIAVLPSRREGLGLFALEAMAAEKPVIVSRAGGLAEVVLPDETGWLVAPDDPVALADGLGQAIVLRNRWRHMGEQGRKHVLRHFTWEHTAQHLLRVYRGLSSR